MASYFLPRRISRSTNFLQSSTIYLTSPSATSESAAFSFANAFLKNTISVQKLNEAMYLGKLGEQVVLKSKKAFSQISFNASSPADRNNYYSKKMLRDSSARDSFFKMRSESELTNTDALFIMDIIRGGIKNGDSRIPEILFK